MEKQSLAVSLIETVCNQEAVKLLAESGEILVDSALKDGLLKDIPILGNLLKLYSIGVNVREALFIKKLQQFLSPLKNISESECQVFVYKLDRDVKFKQQVGENLLLLLDRLDDVGKPSLVADAFKAYMCGKIDYQDFLRLGGAIDRSYLPDILDFAKSKDHGIEKEWAPAMESLGLLEAEVITRMGTSPVLYKRTRLGNLLVETCLSNVNV